MRRLEIDQQTQTEEKNHTQRDKYLTPQRDTFLTPQKDKNFTPLKDKNFTPLRDQNFTLKNLNLKQNLPQPNQSGNIPLQKTDLFQSPFLNQNKELKMSTKITETNENEEKTNYTSKSSELNNQIIKCANQKHQDSVRMVVLDPDLKCHERLLCLECISVSEQNTKTIGIKKVMEKTQENYKKKRDFREIIAQQHFRELEQLRQHLLTLKSFLNKNLDEMIENANMWMTDLQNFKKIEYNLDKEIQWLIDYDQKVEIEQMIDEIKPLNTQWVSKMSDKLEIFSTFQTYSLCQNILNNLTLRKKSQQKEKQEYNQQQGQKQNIQQLQRPSATPNQIHNRRLIKN
ncbi:unnamed protein product [Paramecium octaurelia]|uniref:Uncharacterized protein n=1 Tax=Paramecium octaurelia TaxID=43137 RepID=A0A8S1W2Z7_PAROT|nr:unnamed protein product [Paramecium octaurelia]